MSIKQNARAQINQTIIELIEGDITREQVDAIVNAANSSLLGGGGVDGAIHRAAGPKLLEATRALGGCETGEAKITPGFRLPARFVIHAVGPVYRRDDPNVPKLLASTYRRSLEIAIDHELKSIAFPAISTGIYGYPMDAAASVTLSTVLDVVENQTQIELVRFVLFTDAALESFMKILGQFVEERTDLKFI
ncbi:MAG: O-acetyl-ADP-ribose deacetylase [Anaerolineae bacterium]